MCKLFTKEMKYKTLLMTNKALNRLTLQYMSEPLVLYEPHACFDQSAQALCWYLE